MKYNEMDTEMGWVWASPGLAGWRVRKGAARITKHNET